MKNIFSNKSEPLLTIIIQTVAIKTFIPAFGRTEDLM
jgi:hypothetical protein